MIKINLLPVREEEKKRKLKNQLILAGSTLLLSLLIAIVLNFHINNEIEEIQNNITTTEQEIRKLDVKIGEVNSLDKLKKELESKIEVIKDLNQKREGPTKILDEIGISTPRTVWLSSVNIVGGRVAIKGHALDDPSIANFMKNLERVDVFSAVKLKIIQSVTVEKISVQKFDLNCILK